MSFVSPLGINRLIRGNRIQPRTKLSLSVKLLAFQMNLQKRHLEGIFGQGSVVQVPAQVAVKLSLVPRNQLGEGHPVVASTIKLKQLFV
jgi:hypothetical protein